MRIQEHVLNMLLLAGSLVMIFAIIPAWTPEAEDYGLAPSTLPTLLCGAIACLAVLQSLRLLRGGAADTGKSPQISRELVWHLLRYFGIMLLTFPAWSLLGFVPGSIVILVLLYAAAGLRNWKIGAAVSVLLPLTAYALLWYGLHIPTP